MNCLNIQNYLPPDVFVHCATVQREPTGRQGVDLHTHDFPELFFIEKGQAIHQIQGELHDLHQGDLLFIRPNDQHSIKLKAGHSVRYTNIAFRLEHLEQFQQHFFEEDPHFWGGQDVQPRVVSLTEHQLHEMSLAAQKLSRSSRSRLHLQWFMCELFRIIELPNKSPSTLPLWLEKALREVQNPQHFIKGSSVLAQLSHRSMEHVSREIRKHLNTTPSALINNIRMAYAARRLTQSNLDIIDISLDCGIQSLSQFYSLFKKTHQLSPRQYRLRFQMIN